MISISLASAQYLFSEKMYFCLKKQVKQLFTYSKTAQDRCELVISFDTNNSMHMNTGVASDELRETVQITPAWLQTYFYLGKSISLSNRSCALFWFACFFFSPLAQ
jgi:hypothetical protein